MKDKKLIENILSIKSSRNKRNLYKMLSDITTEYGTPYFKVDYLLKKLNLKQYGKLPI